MIIRDKEFKPLFYIDDIEMRIDDLAKQISKDYKGKMPLFIGILNGSFIFASDLFKKISIEANISFIKLLSYKGASTSGKVIRSLGLEERINGRDIIIIEDIVDTGATLNSFLPELTVQKPASIKIATLLFKPTAVKFDIKPDYVGFEIEDKFVVGYGLDYDGLGRNLNNIYVVKE